MNLLSLSDLTLMIMAEKLVCVLAGLLLLALISLAILTFLYLRQRKKLHKAISISRKNVAIKSSFLSNITLGLRIPISLINNHCDTLEDEKSNPLTEEERSALVEEIHKNSHRMFSYLNELQELTNFDGAIPALATIEVNLAELIMSYRREILHETQRGVMVAIRTTMSPHCKATMDTTIFRQLIMHLLRLGAERTQEGTITIYYEWRNEGLFFKLTDTGDPVTEELRNILFTDQLREEHIIHMDDRNTVASLKICKSIIDSIHGTIEAGEGDEGRGVSVSFWFPCYVRFN